MAIIETNKALVKYQAREIGRLRRELRSANRRYDEMLDKFLFQRSPERLQAKKDDSRPEPSGAVDLFTRAEQDAIRRSEEQSKAESGIVNTPVSA